MVKRANVEYELVLVRGKCRTLIIITCMRDAIVSLQAQYMIVLPNVMTQSSGLQLYYALKDRIRLFKLVHIA